MAGPDKALFENPQSLRLTLPVFFDKTDTAGCGYI
jgi:hypothetical protein